MTQRYEVVQEAPDLYTVRFLLPGRYDYDQGAVVRVQDAGEVLFLSLWLGPPIGWRDWRHARDELFPAARVIQWKRRDPITGEYDDHELRLSAPATERAVP